ncbi:MAG: T9SS type A sorting domain-containing protein [Chitinophagales bacterium]|nr:T9SS type A sorting domain-containing protein [Bacteroidota bacterium]MBK8488580.1 T9SS type A sorting domain-containing protein [Bacteroidota bacterium]MBK8681660.1 T9SS type A sorting domain-containing protein [Bacteroidota bacterium]MBP9190666.1 T9SS type A sorting domain-containing protein [Chitinophagales bacterium]MBP9549880.1 T9SS type A sorting domain-containing protein [Chitinophagales bacterium]
MHPQKSFYFLLIIFISCYFNISANAQRVVFISSYLGNYCDDGMDALDEDVKLFRDVFGHEDDGGWQRFTFDEIDSAAEFLDNTCLLFLDGFCEEEEFGEFYELYRNEINDYVFNGGNLYLNFANHLVLYLGFDSLSKNFESSSTYANIYSNNVNHSIFNAPWQPANGLITCRWGAGPYLGIGSFSGVELDTLLVDSTDLLIGYETPAIALVSKQYGTGQVMASNFAIWLWDQILPNYKNLRRNILYYLSGCMHGDTDIGVVHSVSPQPGCNLTDSEEVAVVIYNYGMQTQTDATVCYVIDDGDMHCEEVSFNLEPQHSDTVFLAAASFAGCGFHTFKAWTILDGDTLNFNDTLFTTIENICAPLTTIGLPDTICINSGLLNAEPEKGTGTWSGMGITADGIFDPMIVGENNSTVINYSYEMPLNYNISTIPFEQPTLLNPDTLTLFDTDYEEVPIGFTFNYFDNTYDSTFISSNGYTSFGIPHTWFVPSLPDNVYHVNNLIVLAGADLNPGALGDVIISTQGEAPYRQFIFQYNDVPCDYEWGITVNVSGILYETTGVIDIVVKHLPPVDIFGITQGISNEEGTFGIETRNFTKIRWFSHAWTFGAEDTAFRFTPEFCPRIITDTILVTGDVAVNVLGNDTTFCPGGSLQIGTDYPGTELLWNTGETSSHIAIEEAGIYTIQMHYGPGDCYLYDTINIASAEQDVFANVLGNDTILCYDDTLQLEINYTDTIYSFNWNTEDTAQTITVTEAGNYALEIEYQSGCSLYDSIAINYNSPILIESTTTPSPDDGPGGSITINVSGGTAPYTYNWSDGLSGTEIENVYPATYYLTVIDALGCSVSTTVSVGIGTGIFDNEISEITIYPNPFDETIQVESDNSINEIEIHNTLGQLVFFKSFNTTENNYIINTSTLPTGMYVLKIYLENGGEMSYVIVNGE